MLKIYIQRWNMIYLKYFYINTNGNIIQFVIHMSETIMDIIKKIPSDINFRI